MKFAKLLPAILLLLAPLTASASRPAPAPPSGYDISYPQCNSKLPTGQTFGIVGVNNGLANTTNPCLQSELTWAAQSTGTTAQPKAQLYVNTANPGGLNTASWPLTGTNVYGTCDGSNSLACAYQYGWNRALEDATIRGVSNPSTYKWWLDVETGNTWDGTTGGQQRNIADLEGMVAYFRSLGTDAGIYSTSYQLGQIAGTIPTTSPINNVLSWIPGASSLSGAQANCFLAPLTAGGKVVMTQWFGRTFDQDNSCI